MLFNVHIGLVLVTGSLTILCVNGFGGDCSFDNGWCGWKNSDHNCFNWTIDKGKTTDKTSGPVSDHTTGSFNGSYAVIYGRRAKNPDCKAVLQSPDIKRVQTPEVLSFWYHMNGNGIGNLTVYTVAENIRQKIWQRQGRQGPDWLLATVPISTWAYRIEFEATSRYRYGSDIAIDDISLHIASSSQRTTTASFTQTTISVIPLPIKCNFDINMCGLTTNGKNGTMVSWERKTGPESFKNSILISGDHTTGKGSYLSLIVNDKKAMIGDEAILNLPVVRNKKMACLTFAYNLPSITSGGIQVFQTDIWTNKAKLVRQVSGNHGRHWQSTHVQFYPSNDPYQVIIEGSYSGEPGYIVAIDDLNFVEEMCEGFITTPTPTTTPTTPTLPPLSVRETPSCQPEYSDILNDVSCDFTVDFCKYLQLKAQWHWKRTNKQSGGWFGKIPQRTQKSYYIVADKDYMIPKNSAATIETGTITDEEVCMEFWYSAPSLSYVAKIELQTTWGHTESIWGKSSIINDGKWTKQSLIIKYHGSYKLRFYVKKTMSSSIMGLDDIRVYKPSTPTTELQSTTKHSYSTTVKSKTTTSMSTETPPTSKKTTRPTNKSLPTRPSSTATVKSSQIVTRKIVLPTTDKSVPTTKATPTVTSSRKTHSVTSGSLQTTNTEYSKPSSAILIHSKIPQSTSKMATQSVSVPTAITESTSQPNATKAGETKGPATQNPKKTTQATKESMTTRNTTPTTIKLIKFPSTHEKLKTTPNDKKTTKANTKKPKITKPFKTENTVMKVTGKTKSITTPPVVKTKADKSKSEHLSPGAQAGIGISVAVLGVGVIAALLFVMKHKLTKSAVLMTDDKVGNNVGLVTLSATYHK